MYVGVAMALLELHRLGTEEFDESRVCSVQMVQASGARKHCLVMVSLKPCQNFLDSVVGQLLKLIVDLETVISRLGVSLVPLEDKELGFEFIHGERLIKCIVHGGIECGEFV